MHGIIYGLLTTAGMNHLRAQSAGTGLAATVQVRSETNGRMQISVIPIKSSYSVDRSKVNDRKYTFVNAIFLQ